MNLQACYDEALGYSMAAIDAERQQDLLSALGNYSRALAVIEGSFIWPLKVSVEESVLDPLEEALKSLHQQNKEKMESIAQVLTFEKELGNDMPESSFKQTVLSFFSKPLRKSAGSSDSKFTERTRLRGTLRDASEPQRVATSPGYKCFNPLLSHSASKAALLAWSPSLNNAISKQPSKPELRRPNTTRNTRIISSPQVEKIDKLIDLSEDDTAMDYCKTHDEPSRHLESETSQRYLAALRKHNEINDTLGRMILNDIVNNGDQVFWVDIAGLEAAKAALKEAVVYPFLRPELFKGLREPARGMLLFGPPGTGKTMLARAVATESQSTFFQISSTSLTSKYLGDSEKLVRALFVLAKELQPSIIFVDEIDSLLSKRSENGTEHEASRRVKSEFLIQWSSLARAAANRDDTENARVLVLAATNLPWQIDEAARRRFVRRQYIPLPERKTRLQQLTNLLKNQNHSIDRDQLEKLVDLTADYSGSDITALAKDAAMGPLRSLGEALLTTQPDKIRPMNFSDFTTSMKSIKPSVSINNLECYESWNKQYGSTT